MYFLSPPQLPVLTDQQKSNIEVRNQSSVIPLGSHGVPQCRSPFLSVFTQAIMLAVMKKLTYDDEYNFENEVTLPS